MAILFGWHNFKRHYILTMTMYAGFLFGLISSLYLTYLLLFSVYVTNVVYGVSDDVIFATNLIMGSLIVVRKIRKIRPNVSYSDAALRFQYVLQV